MESCEESGSYDIEFYFELLKERIGKNVKTISILDSGAGNYENLWVTSSLKGLLMFNLNIEVMQQGIHSGEGSGYVPECFRISRMLLDRIEDVKTGKMHERFHVVIPPESYVQAVEASKTVHCKDEASFLKGVSTKNGDNNINDYLGRTWMPALTIVGMDGIPSTTKGGNVVHPRLTLKCSIRLPPTMEPKGCAEFVQEELTRDAPYGAKVTVTNVQSYRGWNAEGKFSKRFNKILNESSMSFYGKKAHYIGEGGSIPLVNHLQDLYPKS